MFGTARKYSVKYAALVNIVIQVCYGLSKRPHPCIAAASKGGE